MKQSAPMALRQIYYRFYLLIVGHPLASGAQGAPYTTPQAGVAAPIRAEP